ncbi:MAG: ABC transporter permease [Verrucomicrobiales bacterium]|nr:ABC transporter permease [Verrucomicrobiales bacterium]
MLKFIVSRFFQGLLALFCVLTLTFFLSRFAPGSPYTDEKQIPLHIREQMKEQMGLGDSIVVQWAKSMVDAATGFQGPSWGNSGFSVREVIGQAFPVSISVGLSGLFIALGIGVPAGVLAAAKRNTKIDYSLMSIALLGICLPTFVIGPIFAAIFGFQLQWFSAVGWNQPTDFLLPSLVLGLYYGAYIARLTRSGMLDTLSADFIRTARAKGLPEWRVMIIHALRGGLLPVVNYLGPAFSALITGSFVVESIFGLPGLGTHFINAAKNRDYNLIQGTVCVFAILILTLNFVADLLQAVLNPRLRNVSETAD